MRGRDDGALGGVAEARRIRLRVALLVNKYPGECHIT